MQSAIDESTVTKWVTRNVPNVEVRDYQVESWELLQRRRQGKFNNRALVHLATGLGKTSVAAVDVLHYTKVEKRNAKVLFVSHMTDISKQAEDTFLRVNPKFKTMLFKTSKLDKLKSADIVFATFQSLYNNLNKISPTHFDYIVWDEAHHIEADTFKEVREHFQPKFELGLTATPERADGLDILSYFGRPLFAKSLSDGIAEGWLSAVDYHIVFDEAIKEAIANNFELESIKQIQELFSIRTRNEVIAENVLERRHVIGLDKAKTIVFCQNVQMAEQMAELLSGEAYHSGIIKEQRLDVLKRFKKGHLQVICTVDMFNEGIDIPDARLVVFLRSTSSKTIFEQQLGRGLRRAPGKDKVTVLDFVANVERIEFARDLGHTISKARQAIGIRETEGATGEGHAYSAGETIDSFNLSSFEFEDQTIEILDRYNKLKGIEHLTQGMVVNSWNELHSVAKIAEKFNVSTTAIYKHLKKAGVDTSGNTGNITTEQAVEAYYEYGSCIKAAKALGVNSSTIASRVKRAGISLSVTASRYTDEQLLEAYRCCNNNLRKTEIYLNFRREAISKRLKNMGVDVSKQVTPKIYVDDLNEAYYAFSGDINKIVEYFDMGWVEVYKALDYYRYLENIQRPITSAVAAAARYKFGNTVKAAELLGVSTTLVIRKTKKAKYMPKFKQGRS